MAHGSGGERGCGSTRRRMTKVVVDAIRDLVRLESQSIADANVRARPRPQKKQINAKK